jgi:hypothetical protein
MVLKKYMNRTQDAHSMASAGNDENTTESAKREGDAVPQSMKKENNMVGSATRDGNVERRVGASSKESVMMRKRKRRPSSTGSMDGIEEHPPIAMQVSPSMSAETGHSVHGITIFQACLDRLKNNGWLSDSHITLYSRSFLFS